MVVEINGMVHLNPHCNFENPGLKFSKPFTFPFPSAIPFSFQPDMDLCFNMIRM